MSRVALLLALFLPLAVVADITLPPAERIELDNGTVIVLNEKHDVPLIGVQAVLRGGAAADPEGKAGLASLFGALLEKGAGERSAAEFAEAIESVGGRLSAGARLETITISGDFLARDRDLMIELLADMLQRPALARAELDKLRERSINLIRAAKDSDPNNLMLTYAHAFLFGEHPYATPVGGEEASLASITHRDVQRYYAEQVGGDRLIIAVSGSFDADEMRARLTETFGDWRAATGVLPDKAAPAAQSDTRVLLIDKPGATQTYFWIGNVGVAIDYRARAALDVANTVFGGSFTSMLNNALRIESGLTYGARSRLVRPSLPGSVGISSYTATESSVEAIDMALGLLDELHANGLTAERLDGARNYILGQYPTTLETATQLAAEFAELEFYGLPRDYIDGYADALAGVTPEIAATVISDVYPRRDSLVFVLLGDADAIRDDVQKYGPVTEMSITEPRFSPSE